MSCERHDWRPTARWGIHSKIGKAVTVRYWRCAACGQVGFTRPGSSVMFTWSVADTDEPVDRDAERIGNPREVVD